MNAIQAALALLIGLAGGVVSGFFGTGGAVVIVPALVYLIWSNTKHKGHLLGHSYSPSGYWAFWNTTATEKRT